MGLECGFDKKTGKWYSKGLWFIKTYDTKEEMEADYDNALEEYLEHRRNFGMFIEAFAALR